MLKLLPWHQKQWAYIVRARQTGRLPHALLLQGMTGAGTNEFAHYLGASLLCGSPDANFAPCGACKLCYLYEAGNHTDMQIIQPEEEGKQVRVEQIRALIEFISLKSQFEGHKVAIIRPADAMNKSAANTLLKTLEEPPPLSILILVTERPGILPVTIRSRCQQIRFQPEFTPLAHSWLSGQIPDRKLAKELLALSQGAPLAALEMYNNGTLDNRNTLLADLDRLTARGGDPVKTAKQWNDMGAEQVLRCMLQVTVNMIRLHTGTTGVNGQRTDTCARMGQLTNRLNLYKLVTCYDLLMRNYRLCTGQVSFDTQGLLEEFIVHWQQQSGG